MQIASRRLDPEKSLPQNGQTDSEVESGNRYAKKNATTPADDHELDPVLPETRKQSLIILWHWRDPRLGFRAGSPAPAGALRVSALEAIPAYVRSTTCRCPLREPPAPPVPRPEDTHKRRLFWL